MHDVRRKITIAGLPPGWKAEYVEGRGCDSPDKGYEAHGPKMGMFVRAGDKRSLLQGILETIEVWKPLDILLDVDEVVAAWRKATLKLLKLDEGEVIKRWSTLNPRPWDLFEVIPVSSADVWRLINGIGSKFWEEIDPLPWANELVDLCISLAPTTFLTTAIGNPSYSGKAAWLDRHFPSMPRLIIGNGCKSVCAHSRSLLIDDYPKNCAAFSGRSGDAILFPSYGNGFHDLVEDPMPYIRKQLSMRFGKDV